MPFIFPIQFDASSLIGKTVESVEGSTAGNQVYLVFHCSDGSSPVLTIHLPVQTPPANASNEDVLPAPTEE